MILPALQSAAAKAIRYKPFEYPSQWLAREYYLTVQSGSDAPGRFDIWRNPVNVDIVDSMVEPGRRGHLVQKCVQSGVSTYEEGALGYFISRVGGSLFYCLAKNDTMDKHARTRIAPMIEHSQELRDVFLAGRTHNERILEKSFLTGSLTMTSSGSEKNFISVPYRVMFLDEIEQMGVFPSGNDAFKLATGRQQQVTDPRLYGFSVPGHPESGICAYVEHDSDCREFHVRCPHCREAITFDPLRDIVYDHEDGSNRRRPETARLCCSECREEITDTQRGIAIVRAAKAACPWYTDEPYDDEVGWVSMLSPDVAATREYAGFRGYSQLLNPRSTVLEIALEDCGAHSEAQKKVVYNDIFGLGYAMDAQVITIADIKDREADGKRHHVPTGTQWITAGVDVQGGGPGGDLVFYYDVSAWMDDTRKVTLDIDRMLGTYARDYQELVDFLAGWSGVTDAGMAYRLKMVAIDAGWRTKAIYSICNRLSPRGAQWAAPIVYNREKVSKASYVVEQQGDNVGDPRRQMWLASRDWLVSRAIDRVLADNVELPRPLPPEVAQHYVANIHVEDYDRHGNFRGYHWQKRQVAKGQRLDDDWLQAACYSEFAAVLVGLDELRGAGSTAARAAAEEHVQRRNANRDSYRAQRQIRNRLKYQARHDARR
ncbi:MAG: hypothetical protein GY851_15515 [bacterium]|nr:hypothetical protein [bacterium]